MEEIEVEGPTKPVTDHSADTRSPVARHSFYIQDILSPEFGNKQLTDQYYAYLRYCYSLHIQNVMLLHNQQHLQMLSKRAERQEYKQMGSSPDELECLSNIHRSRVSNRVVRPTPRSDLKMRPVMVEGQGKRCLDSFLQSPTRGQLNTTVVTSSRTCSNDPVKDSSCNVKSSYGVEPISPASCSTDKPDGGIQRSPQVKSRHVSSGGDKQSSRDNSKVAAESVGSKKESSKRSGGEGDSSLWPAWVYCTRYSDRPSSGPRSRKIKRKSSTSAGESSPSSSSEKRPRIAFTNEQLGRLKREFEENRYLTEDRRAKLASQLELTESQVKIWFQNKRAKLKKSTGTRNPLAIQLMQQGLYNHATVPTDQDGMDDEEIQAD